MNKGLAFWVLSATVLFLLSVAWLSAGLHRKNIFFTAWLGLGLGIQLLAAYWLGASRPAWVLKVRLAGDAGMYFLCAMTLARAALDRHSTANRTLLYGLGGMLALNVLGRAISGDVGNRDALCAWLRNIAFFGPAVWMLFVFSGIRLDRLPAVVAKITDLKAQMLETSSAGLKPGATGIAHTRDRRPAPPQSPELRTPGRTA